MTKTILQREHPSLRNVANAVRPDEVRGEKVQNAIKDMRAALLAQDDGVAIAAPQIGIPLRIFLLSEKVAEVLQNDGEKSPRKKNALPQVFINPLITKRSREKHTVEEGCLSVRYAYGKIIRAKKVTLHALDETGAPFERGASGLLAQIFQHETDHLDGILFIDSAKDVRELTPEEVAREREQLTEK